MTSLAIAEGWTMASSGLKDRHGRGGWHEVIVAWTVAAALAGALVLTLPNQNKEGSPQRLWSLAPAAASHPHLKATDDEGPVGDEACSNRDFANERC